MCSAQVCSADNDATTHSLMLTARYYALSTTTVRLDSGFSDLEIVYEFSVSLSECLFEEIYLPGLVFKLSDLPSNWRLLW